MIDGTVDRRFESVRDAFASILAKQRGTGAAFAARCDDVWVVDLWGGHADAARTRPWGRDSVVQPYSVSKPFGALCALVLVDRGLLDLDAPVQRYWPEFVAPATVRQVLSHQAGVVALDRQVRTQTFYDWNGLCSLLAAQEPAWPPGKAHGESALFFGHLVGELVRRVDGRSLGQFLRAEVTGPLGLDFTIGLSRAEQDRAVEVTGLDDQFRAANAAGRPELYQRAIGNPPGAQDPSVVNSAAWRGAEIPAVNGQGTARGVAGLYAALMGGALLSPGLWAEATAVECSGIDAVFGHHNAFGLGFAVEAEGIGMGGLGGNYGGGCRAGGYALAYVTGSVGTFEPVTLLENELRSCLGMAPLD